jgi:hypothetical protein
MLGVLRLADSSQQKDNKKKETWIEIGPGLFLVTYFRQSRRRYFNLKLASRVEPSLVVMITR